MNTADKHIDRPRKILGKGSEATIYASDDGITAIKTYDRFTDRKLASQRARREYGRLAAAEVALAGIPGISVPRPISETDDPPGFVMQRVSGINLMDAALKGLESDAVLARLAERVSRGILTLLETPDIAEIDATLDNVMFDAARDELVFIDFSDTPNDPKSQYFRSTAEDAALHLIGSAIYEASRPGRFRSLVGIDRLARLTAHVVQPLLDGRSTMPNGTLIRVAHLESLYSMEGGSWSRNTWYRIVGWIVNRRFSQVFLAELAGKNARPAPATALQRVLFFVWDYPSKGQGTRNGVHIAVKGLAEGILQSGIGSAIMSLGAHPGFDRSGLLRIESYPTGWIPASIRYAPRMMRRIRHAGPGTAIVLNGVFNLGNCLLAHGLRRANIPYIVAPHTNYSPALFRSNRLLKRTFWQFLERPMLNGALAIHVLDGRMIEKLHSMGVKSRIFATPNGIPGVAKTSPDNRPSFPGHTPDNPTSTDSGPGIGRLFYFGRIEAEAKGLFMLLDAIAGLPENSRLDITLQGPDQGDGERLQRRADELGIGSQFHLLPPNYETNPSHMMERYDVFVLPSRYEGFPISGMEAMKAGIPVLMTDVGGLAAIVREIDCGVVVQPETDAIRRGLELMLERRHEWRQMGSRGQEHVRTHLTWDTVGSRFLKEVKEVLQNA